MEVKKSDPIWSCVCSDSHHLEETKRSGIVDFQNNVWIRLQARCVEDWVPRAQLGFAAKNLQNFSEISILMFPVVNLKAVNRRAAAKIDDEKGSWRSSPLLVIPLQNIARVHTLGVMLVNDSKRLTIRLNIFQDWLKRLQADQIGTLFVCLEPLNFKELIRSRFLDRDLNYGRFHIRVLINLFPIWILVVASQYSQISSGSTFGMLIEKYFLKVLPHISLVKNISPNW